MALVSIRISRLVRSLGAIGASLALAGFAQAQLTYLQATINGTQEVPPTPSTGTGVGCFSFDSSTNTLSYNISFSGLLGPETAAHIHSGAPGVNGAVVVSLPLGSPISGTAPLTAAQASQLLAGNMYVNIHTTVFGGGEVRGQINPIAPATLFCFGDGSAGTCPCGNNSILGNNEGCLNSAGVGGKLVSSGGTSVSCDSFQLCASQLLGANSIFLQGSAAPVGPFAFGDGLRCVGGQLRRLGITPISGGSACLGGMAGTPPLSVLGQVTAGLTYGYQVYYRDPQNFCTSLTYNITNGALVTWAP